MSLIFPRLVEIRIIDHTATVATGGHVTTARRRLTYSNPNDGTLPTDGKVLRTVRVEAQFESGSHRALSWRPAGDTPKTNAGLVFDEDDLIARDLLRPENGLPVFGVGDAYIAAYDVETEALLTQLDEPGIKIVELRVLDKLPGYPQLYLAVFEDRPTG